MLLRSIQLFSDGERSLSDRQAVIAYMGACEALFGHRKNAGLYTCTGIALCSDDDFEANKSAATRSYDDKSRAVHEGKSPDSSEDARLTAYQKICYVIKNKTQLSSKKAIRSWIEEYITASATAEE